MEIKCIPITREEQELEETKEEQETKEKQEQEDQEIPVSKYLTRPSKTVIRNIARMDSKESVFFAR